MLVNRLIRHQRGNARQLLVLLAAHRLRVGLGIHALVVFVFGGDGPWGQEWEQRKTRDAGQGARTVARLFTEQRIRGVLRSRR